jgi:hypothetical protein
MNDMIFKELHKTNDVLFEDMLREIDGMTYTEYWKLYDYAIENVFVTVPDFPSESHAISIFNQTSLKVHSHILR